MWNKEWIARGFSIAVGFFLFHVFLFIMAGIFYVVVIIPFADYRW